MNLEAPIQAKSSHDIGPHLTTRGVACFKDRHRVPFALEGTRTDEASEACPHDYNWLRHGGSCTRLFFEQFFDLFLERLKGRRRVADFHLVNAPVSADHDHVHHIMRDAGFSPAGTAIGLSVFTLLAGLLMGQCMRWNLPEPLLMAAYLAAMAFWFLLTAKRARAVAFFRAGRFWARAQPSDARNDA